MRSSQLESLSTLYETDETAWLDAMAELVAQRRFEELDHTHLSEFLIDMARRDRREVFSRLVILLVHLLKWEHQPEQRSGSWRGTIRTQRRELRQLLESGALLKHATEILQGAYDEARKQASDETEMSLDAFPLESPWDLETALDDELETNGQ